MTIRPTNFDYALNGKRNIYRFDWPSLFELFIECNSYLFIECNSYLVEQQEDIEILRQYVNENKFYSRVIIEHSFLDELKRVFYCYLTILENSNLNHVSNFSNFIPEYNFSFVEIYYDIEFEKWLDQRIITDSDLQRMFPSYGLY